MTRFACCNNALLARLAKGTVPKPVAVMQPDAVSPLSENRSSTAQVHCGSDRLGTPDGADTIRTLAIGFKLSMTTKTLGETIFPI